MKFIIKIINIPIMKLLLFVSMIFQVYASNFSTNETDNTVWLSATAKILPTGVPEFNRENFKLEATLRIANEDSLPAPNTTCKIEPISHLDTIFLQFWTTQIIGFPSPRTSHFWRANINGEYDIELTGYDAKNYSYAIVPLEDKIVPGGVVNIQVLTKLLMEYRWRIYSLILKRIRVHIYSCLWR